MVIEQSNVLILIHSSLIYLHFPTQPALKLIASQIYVQTMHLLQRFDKIPLFMSL